MTDLPHCRSYEFVNRRNSLCCVITYIDRPYNIMWCTALMNGKVSQTTVKCKLGDDLIWYQVRDYADRKLICQLCDYLRNSLCTLHSRRVIHPEDTSLGSTWSTAFGNVIVVCFLYGNKHVLDPESIFGLVCNDLSARCGAVSVYIWQYFICSAYTSSCRVLHSCTAFQRPSRHLLNCFYKLF